MMSFFSVNRPFLVAGPCSAETREQVLATAAELSPLNIHLYRAGVWKPRTRPGNFEGNGAIALKWLQEVKETFGLKTAIEIADPTHAELALKHNIDVVWIGARTTVNPFQVQSIAEALKGVKIPVMIKNPVNPEIELWQGAIERFEKVGIEDIAAVHRGFSGYASSSGYRNQPNWVIPIELKRRRPDCPIICDPSHIAGKRIFVAELAQKAMDMHFDGLMIETHNSPDDAWSDAAQQITPEELKELLSKLIVREEFAHDMNSVAKLEFIRQQIDSLDAEIIDLIAKRMEFSEKIGLIKRESNMTIYQPGRWREIVETCNQKAALHNLSKDFVVELYEKIHHESIRIQLSILEKTEKQAS